MEDPAHGKQENVAFNGHFGKKYFHPLFAFASDGDCLGARLRPGNVHSAYGVVAFLDPIVRRYRSRFIPFWLRGDAAFAQPEVYNYCEGEPVSVLHQASGQCGAEQTHRPVSDSSGGATSQEWNSDQAG